MEPPYERTFSFANKDRAASPGESAIFGGTKLYFKAICLLSTPMFKSVEAGYTCIFSRGERWGFANEECCDPVVIITVAKACQRGDHPKTNTLPIVCIRERNEHESLSVSA